MTDIETFGANPLRAMALGLAAQSEFSTVGELLAAAQDILAFLEPEKAPERTSVVAEFYASKAEEEDVMYGRGYAWFVADNKAYYRYSDGEITRSAFSPQELRTSGRFELRALDPVDLSTLEGIEGRA